ncbi:hypothetical protein A5893_10300 [Pedobacter psychrophilus]|uniref:CAAX prenyl protease 2/Lysostaphin resistance protein A-like domain-containing protein n=1 Tax=Pedobacter psychrophilus TaxID=1826909 RepID=A0A179DEC8_9SPHI|nr:CPBP family glutamic-type intramembrane protease [Pedobacter psychrophilus]OAQ39060.1 hypothetical protein A5893_10300 [Pedobacter psychrophilus]
MVQQAFQEFLTYIKKPDPFIKEDKRKIFYNQLFPLVIISLCFSFVSVIFVSLLENLHLINELPDFKLFDLKEKKIWLFLMVTVFAPILEELIFRYQLKNYYMSIVCYALLAIGLLYKIFTGLTLFISIGLVVIIGFMVIITFGNNHFKKHQLISKLFHSHFYLTAICFGISHVYNYSNPFEYGFPIILLVLPQIFLGFILGYVRMRFGLLNSMIMHSAYNFIPALALLAGY